MALHSTCHARRVSWGRCYFDIFFPSSYLLCFLYDILHMVHAYAHMRERRPSIKVKHSVNYSLNTKSMAGNVECSCSLRSMDRLNKFGFNLILIRIIDTLCFCIFDRNLCTACAESTNRTIDFKTANFLFIYFSIPKTKYLAIEFLVLISCELTSWFKANNLSIQKKRIRRQRIYGWVFKAKYTNKKERQLHARPCLIRDSEWECKARIRIVFILLCFNLFIDTRWIDYIQYVACVVCKQMEYFRMDQMNHFGCYVKLQWQIYKKGKRIEFLCSSSNISFLAYVWCHLRSKSIGSLMFEEWNQQQQQRRQMTK